MYVCMAKNRKAKIIANKNPNSKSTHFTGLKYSTLK